MLKIEMKGYASIDNAVRAGQKWFEKHGIEDPQRTLKIHWWWVMPTTADPNRYVPVVSVGQCPGGPGMFLGGPFFIVN